MRKIGEKTPPRPSFGIHSGDVVMVVFDLWTSLGKQVLRIRVIWKHVPKMLHLGVWFVYLVSLYHFIVYHWYVQTDSNIYLRMQPVACYVDTHTHTRCYWPTALWIKGCYISIQHHSTCWLMEYMCTSQLDFLSTSSVGGPLYQASRTPSNIPRKFFKFHILLVVSTRLKIWVKLDHSPGKGKNKNHLKQPPEHPFPAKVLQSFPFPAEEIPQLPSLVA